MVFRYDGQGVPDPPAAHALLGGLQDIEAAAKRRKINVTGLQLDIDSPTADLAQYAAFLRDIKGQLPKGWQLSITALLDWFRTGTAVSDVIAATDEFVPQFYDVAERHSWYGPATIAKKIDARQWGPAFNRLGKRFRVGISTFGRAQMASREGAPRRYLRVGGYGIRPIDIAANPAFNLETFHNDAGELLLTYRAARKTGIVTSSLSPGTAFSSLFPLQRGFAAP